MEKIQISPWHLSRQHLSIIVRKVKDVGIREVGRKAKVGHSIVGRFCHSPEVVNIQTIYRIADAVGMVFRLEIQPNLPHTEKTSIGGKVPAKRQPRGNNTNVSRKRDTSTTKTPGLFPLRLPPAVRLLTR